MLKILLAVDGSEPSVRATRKLVEMLALWKEAPAIDLVTVHPPVPYLGGFSGVVVSHEMVQRHYNEDGEHALAPCARVLDDAGVAYTRHILVGDPAHVIARHAHDSGCGMIYMGTRGLTGIPSLVLGSVATKVLHLADVPVVLIH